MSFDGKYDEPGDLAQSISNQLTIIERNAGLVACKFLDSQDHPPLERVNPIRALAQSPE
ncbi:MAG: hypothetical protein OXI10_10950 [Gammaproteobacteria bacterium]|nr:hypothetical protein [Gammaproteobacteria bacterium]